MAAKYEFDSPYWDEISDSGLSHCSRIWNIYSLFNCHGDIA
jgi:hypothetical protein